MLISDIIEYNKDSKRHNRAYKLHCSPKDISLFVPYLTIKKYDKRAKEWEKKVI